MIHIHTCHQIKSELRHSEWPCKMFSHQWTQNYLPAKLGNEVNLSRFTANANIVNCLNLELIYKAQHTRNFSFGPLSHSLQHREQFHARHVPFRTTIEWIKQSTNINKFQFMLFFYWEKLKILSRIMAWDDAGTLWDEWNLVLYFFFLFCGNRIFEENRFPS